MSAASPGDERGVAGPALLAISDLHVDVPENRAFLERIEPGHPGDWLIVAGDAGENMAQIEWALRTLAGRFERVIWVPGNHELWTRADDPVPLRGRARYEYLVEHCRSIGVCTPEDPYPVWDADGQRVCVAPLFTLYDYSFGRERGSTRQERLARAREAGVVCTDEYVLFTDPYESAREWCRARVLASSKRLEAVSLPTVLVDHYPLREELTSWLRYPDFAQWCGTTLTAEWHRRHRAVAVVYGHLHIPGTRVIDGVPFHEVSLGYPRQWSRRIDKPLPPHSILPSRDPARDG